MTSFATKILPAAPDVTAPDGSDVRILLGLAAGGMAHFELGPGRVAKAIRHCTVEEVWFVVRGRGEMWRKLGEQEEIVALHQDVCLTIPVGTHFQFRAFGYEPLSVVGATMPPWPGEDEAVFVEGPWTAG